MSFDKTTGGTGVGTMGEELDLGEQLMTKLMNAKKRKFMPLRLFIFKYWIPLS
jgi:hypothetical protein